MNYGDTAPQSGPLMAYRFPSLWSSNISIETHRLDYAYLMNSQLLSGCLGHSFLESDQ